MRQLPERIGLVGLGAIGSSIARSWQRPELQALGPLAAVCLRPGQESLADELLHPDTVRVTSPEALVGLQLDMVMEAAGHGFILQHGGRLLSSGIDLMILSVGALAVDDTLPTLKEAAVRGGSRMIFPSGAFAGFDGLRSLAQTGSLQTVIYTSTKPPRAWKGTAAEASLDLDNLTQRQVFFEGSAREAARLYPKNANLAAAVALAGIGLDATRVQLVADPQATGNQGAVRAVSGMSTLELTLGGAASSRNPKTSEITAYSVIAALCNSMDPCTFW